MSKEKSIWIVEQRADGGISGWHAASIAPYFTEHGAHTRAAMETIREADQRGAIAIEYRVARYVREEPADA